VEIFVVAVSVLVGCVEDVLLNLRTFLVVQQAEVICVLAHHRESVEGRGETIPDRHAFQASEESFVVLGLSQDLFSDSRCVLTAVALSEDEKGAAAGDAQYIEAAFAVLVEFLEGLVEVVGQLAHVGNVGVGVAGVGIAETGAHGLVHEQDVVVAGPCVLVAGDGEGSGVSGADVERAELEEVSKLTGGTGSSVEPDDGGDTLELFLGGAFLAEEEEGECGASLVDAEVARHDSAVVVVCAVGVEVNLAAGGIDLQLVVLEVPELSVGDVEATLFPVARVFEHSCCQCQEEDCDGGP
jgi:hypothetical protein